MKSWMLGVLTDLIDENLNLYETNAFDVVRGTEYEYFRLKPYSAYSIPIILYLHDPIFKEFKRKTLSPIMKKKLDEVKYPVSELIHVDEIIR